MFAIFDAYHAGLFKTNNWMRNIVAGLIVGIVALPLAMAFAVASGVKPEQGLYTAIIAGLLVGVFGGSRVQIAGPTGAFVVILSSITAHYGVSGLQIASLLAGIMLIGMGLAKFGDVIKFIPDPVIVGFTAGIGAVIFVNEWKDFFGLGVQIPLDAKFHQKLYALIQSLSTLHLATTLLALLSLALVIITPKIIKRVPGPLVAMVVATVLQTLLRFDGVATIGSVFGGIPHTLPHFALPDSSFTQMLALISPAFTIALLGAIESLLSATVADGILGTRHDSNKELIGQGLANIVAPLFGGFASTGAIARTVTNVRNGGNSPLAAITHSVVLILVIVLLAPLAAYIPFAALAAILFVVAYNMSDIPHFMHIAQKAPAYDVLVLVTTFILTIFVDLVVAVSIGMILSLLFFTQRMHQAVIVEQQTHAELATELQEAYALLPLDTVIYSIQGPFFFGAAEKIETALASTNTDPKNIILRLKDVPFIDATGLETFTLLIEQYHKRGIVIYVCEANRKVTTKLRHFGATQWIGNSNITDSLLQFISSNMFLIN